MYTIAEIEAMWFELGSVTFKNTLEAIVLAEDWKLWEAGTSVYDIRKWFNENHPEGLTYLQSKI